MSVFPVRRGNPAKRNSVGWNRTSRPFSLALSFLSMETHSKVSPPSPMVDGLRQPSIRGRLIPSASRAQPISHSSRAALHISQTCPQCRQSNANTALILELKPPSFANTRTSKLLLLLLPLPRPSSFLPPRATPAVRELLNHYGK